MAYFLLLGEVELEENEYDDEDLSAQDLIDFSPVYRCLHIFSVLGSRDTFETYYRQQRKQQARLVLQPPTNMVRQLHLISMVTYFRKIQIVRYRITLVFQNCFICSSMSRWKVIVPTFMVLLDSW